MVARDLKLLKLKEDAYERTIQGRMYLEQILKERLDTDEIDSFRDYAPSGEGLRHDYVQEYYREKLGVDNTTL